MFLFHGRCWIAPVFLRLILHSWSSTALYEEYFDESARCVKQCRSAYEGNLNTTWTGKPCREWRSGDVSGSVRLR